MEYNTAGVVIRTLQCRLFGKADVARWRDADAFDSSWEERTRLIAQLVPKATRVIEFGSGQRKLESQLDASCFYLPSDLVSRGAGTVVFDLNTRPLPDLRAMKLDVAILAGVLEYIVEPRSFIAWLSQQVTTCIASYNCARTRSRSFGRSMETLRRTGAGWVNTFNEEEFIGIFRLGGFGVAQNRNWNTPDGSEHIFVFHTLAARPKTSPTEEAPPALGPRREQL